MSIVSPSSWPVFIISALVFGLSGPSQRYLQSPLSIILPILSVISLIPFIHSAKGESKRGDLFRWWLWGIVAVGSGSTWLLTLEVEGYPGVMYLALLLLALFFGAWYSILGFIIKKTAPHRSPLFILAVPSIWICIDYLKTLGALSFPWHFLGYNYIHILPLSQILVHTGIWGLTFWGVFAATLILDMAQTRKYSKAVLYTLLSIILVIWGAHRITQESYSEDLSVVRVGLIQSWIDQSSWCGSHSLDTAIYVSDTLIASVASDADLIVLPESGLFAYLERNRQARNALYGWVESYGIPVITGSLHYEQSLDGGDVYNGAALLRPQQHRVEWYFKQKLVPFGESLPLKGILPLINRLDLGGGDFSRGVGVTTWSIAGLLWAPSICYESIYPAFMRSFGREAQIFVNVTNDGWFGTGAGPYQHATIARARAIENGIPMVRVANSGISTVVDPYGRVKIKTALMARTAVVAEVKAEQSKGLYSLFGDWFVALSLLAYLLIFFSSKHSLLKQS